MKEWHTGISTIYRYCPPMTQKKRYPTSSGIFIQSSPNSPLVFGEFLQATKIWTDLPTVSLRWDCLTTDLDSTLKVLTSLKFYHWYWNQLYTVYFPIIFILRKTLKFLRGDLYLFAELDSPGSAWQRMDIKRGMDHATKIVLEEPSWEEVVARRGWSFFPNKRHPMFCSYQNEASNVKGGHFGGT